MRGFSQGITALAALLASTSTTALAQETSDGANNDDEIVVTAQRREQSLLDVPLAVSALGGDDLAQKGIDNSSELAAAVPNLQINSPFGNTQPNFSLRGIGVANEYNSNQASPVGVYIDDVYLAPRTSHGMGCSILTGLKCCVGRKARCSDGTQPAVPSTSSPGNRRLAVPTAMLNWAMAILMHSLARLPSKPR